MRYWYYYLHENGDIIGKNPVVVDSDSEYFNSPFVKKVWKIDLDNRSNAWMLVLEALALDARLDRVKELVEKWKLTKEDMLEYMVREIPTKLLVKGADLFLMRILNENLDDFEAWGIERLKEKYPVKPDLVSPYKE